MLVSVHIPKCAGTSFRHLLQRVYGPALWMNYGAAFTRAQAAPGCIPEGTKCIHGHFFADTFDELIPSRTLITWLRHPVERVVSHYHHFLRSPDMRDDCCRLLHERKLTLRQFAELDWMRNQASRYFAGKRFSDFAFVGVAENFEISVRALAQMFDWPLPAVLPRDNVNPGRTSRRYRLPESDYFRILELNDADLRLYDEALCRLWAAELDSLVSRWPAPVRRPCLARPSILADSP